MTASENYSGNLPQWLLFMIDKNALAQPAIACSKSTTETLE